MYLFSQTKIPHLSNESDIDITDNTDLVYQLYARKIGNYFVNKVTHFGLEDLRSDLIERARTMTSIRNANHPWKSMSDEELLRSAGLVLRDETTRNEGVTIAAILLFGKDSTIMSVLPQHKTDAIFRVKNLDRDVFRTIVPLNKIAIGKVGPGVSTTDQDKIPVKTQVKTQDAIRDAEPCWTPSATSSRTKKIHRKN